MTVKIFIYKVPVCCSSPNFIRNLLEHMVLTTTRISVVYHTSVFGFLLAIPFQLNLNGIRWYLFLKLMVQFSRIFLQTVFHVYFFHFRSTFCLQGFTVTVIPFGPTSFKCQWWIGGKIVFSMFHFFAEILRHLAIFTSFAKKSSFI